jgi:hypothetical protein
MRKSGTPTPERQAILEHLKWALATRGSYQQRLLPFMAGLLRQCRDLDLSAADVEQAVEDWQRNQYADCPETEDESRVLEMFRDRIVEMCMNLRRYPLEWVQAVIDEQCSKLAEARRNENTLVVSEKEMRTGCTRLDERIRLAAGILMYMGDWTRFDTIAYWTEIYEQMTDPEFLRAKAKAYTNDPEIGFLAKAFLMGESVAAMDM